MNILKAWKEAEEQKDRFRHLEKALELPKNSIQYEYVKELVLLGIQINEAQSIHSKLMAIASETPFPTETVLAVHRTVKDVDLVKKIMDWGSQRRINPLTIAELIKIDPTEIKPLMEGLVESLKDALAIIEDEQGELGDGEHVKITKVLMTQAEYETLPEFDGY